MADSVPDAIPDVDAIPEPEVKAEPPSRIGNRAYTVQGRRYEVLGRAAEGASPGGVVRMTPP